MAIDIHIVGRLGTGQDISVIELSNAFMQARFLNLGATLWQLIPRGHPSDDGVCLFWRCEAASGVAHYLDHRRRPFGKGRGRRWRW